MGYKIIYKPLFEVRIWHDYLLNKGEDYFDDLSQVNQDEILKKYDINKYLDIVPTPGCLRLMKNYHLIHRKTRYGFIIAIKVDEMQQGQNTRYTPFVPWQKFFSLAFTIQIKDSNFVNFTNLSQQQLQNVAYHLTNIDPDTVRTYPSLSSKTGKFEAKKHYDAGALIIRSNKLYESIIDIPEGEVNSFNASHWNEIPKKSYFNPDDQILLAKGFYKYVFTTNSIRSANFVMTKWDGTVVVDKRISSQRRISDFTLSLNELDPGYYTLSITGTSNYEDQVQFYWDPLLIREKPFALIEIAHYPDLQGNDYQLFEPGSDNLLREEEDLRIFELRFKNRSTFWCYIFGEAQSGNFGDFVPVDPENKVFVNTKIRQLTQYPIEIKRFSEDTLLPNPSINNIYPKRRSYPVPEKSIKIYSEVFL